MKAFKSGMSLPRSSSETEIDITLKGASLTIDNRYTRSYFEDHPSMNLDSNYAMDETAVWFVACGSRTVDTVGEKFVSLATTGHNKQNVTVALTTAASGAKGKSLKAEDRTLKARRDINVAYSDHGWFNTDLTID